MKFCRTRALSALRRSLPAIACATLAILVARPGAAQTVSIFDMRKSLPLDANEPVYRDFYINAGPEAGLKAGMYVSVFRPLPVHDPISNKAQANLNVQVGRLRIIQVERGLAVARIHSETHDDERPTLEYEGILIGDRIDLASATSDEPKARPRPKPVRKPSVAETTEEKAREAAATAAPAPPSAPQAAAAPANEVPPGAVAETVPAAPSDKQASAEQVRIRVPVAKTADGQAGAAAAPAKKL